jgi:hypothetical protein
MGNPPVTTAFGISNFNSSQLNETQTEVTHYGVLALQKSVPGFDGQLSYFTRYNALQFNPDVVGDLLLNGIASHITRTSYTNGFQGDGSFQVNPANTVRAGFTVSFEKATVTNFSTSSHVPFAMAPITERLREYSIQPPSSACSWGSMLRTSGKSPTNSR